MASSALPYLKKMAKGGDADAVGCLRKMADEGDDDAAQALNDMGDGNGAQPDLDLGKSEPDGDLFDLEALEKAIADVEPFADVENAPEATVEAIQEDISGRPEVQAAAAVDAGDFVKSLAAGIESALERNGDVAAWAAQAAEAVATGFGVQGELLKSVTDSNDRLAKSVDGLREMLGGMGAGQIGATTTAQAAALAKSFAVRGADEPTPGTEPTGGQNKGLEAQVLRKSLREMREGTEDRAKLGKINNALDALTVLHLAPAQQLVANS